MTLRSAKFNKNAEWLNDRLYYFISVKLDNWFEKLIDEKISPEQHDRILTKLTERQEQLNDKLDVLTKGNKNFFVTVSYLLDLLNRAKRLFELADENQRSKLIGFMVSNLQLNDKKLSYTVNYPFDLVIEQNKTEPDGSESSIWCGLGDSNSWPLPWQGSALTTELNPHVFRFILAKRHK